MKQIRKLISIVSIFLMLFLLVSCQQSKQTMDKIKLAEVTHSIFYAPQYVAIEKGFFEEQNIEIELVGAQGADKTMAALLSKEVQIGFMGPEASIYVYNQGNKDYSVCFAQLTKRDGSFLISRQKEDNFSFDNLKGKEILGGRKGGVPEMTLEYVIKQKGLTIGENVAADEVNVRTDVQFNVMAGAFTGGEGDYVTLFEPLGTSLEKEGKGYIVASIGSESGEIPYTAYCALGSYIEQNEELIQKFTNAIYKGQVFVATNTAETIADIIGPQFTELSREDLITVIQRYKDIDAWCQTPVLEEENLNHLMDVMETAGELNQRVPYDKIVTTRFATRVQK